jgi:hypothetical protein
MPDDMIWSGPHGTAGAISRARHLDRGLHGESAAALDRHRRMRLRDTGQCGQTGADTLAHRRERRVAGPPVPSERGPRLVGRRQWTRREQQRSDRGKWLPKNLRPAPVPQRRCRDQKIVPL